MKCLKCGFKNPKQARFCASCGVVVAAIECPHCQTENEPGSRFCNSCGHSMADIAADQSKRAQQVERRMLTVLFCDLVDSTEMVDSMDPELSRNLIREYQSIAKGVIENFGGRITEYLGDGIVAQFTRYETNAERAINAALEIIQSLAKADIRVGDSEQKARVRCGIATGLAVVGDMLGDDEIRSESAVGLPLNLAARIQSLAGENQVVIGKMTQQLAHGLFEFEDIGQHALKGFKELQQVWRVVAKQSISSRFVAHAAELTPMVNRTEISAKLMASWQACKKGEAKAILFWGEAGIGKSRIVQELMSKISIECVHVEYQCSAYHTNTAFYPLISGLEATAKIAHDDNNAVRLRKLARLVRWSSDDFEHDMPALVNVLSLSAEDKWPTPNLDPDEIKEWIYKAAVNNLRSLSAKKPLLIQVEDVHWIDPTTLELINRLVVELKGHPVLLLITTRPGFSSDFMQHPQVSKMEVQKLPLEFRRQLIEQIKGENNQLDSVMDEIIERTEGIPLYIEELSKSLLERTASGNSEAESNLLAQKDIPTTLHDSLLSRLDFLPDKTRSIALLASVIGREFSYDLLEEIADLGTHNLYELLSPLLEAQLILQLRAPPHAKFSFKHALVRDVAYETLLQSDRVEIHNKIALCLEKFYPATARTRPESLAYHFTAGKTYDKAVYYWLEAGKRASQKFALVEAKEHLTTGLQQLDGLSENDENKTIRLEYLITLGPVLIALEGPGAELTRHNYTQAVALCEQLPESVMHFTALWGQWHVLMDYNRDQGVGSAEKLQRLAEKLDDDELKLQAHHCQWTTRFHHADFAKAKDHLETGLALYDIDHHRHHSSVYGGHDPNVCGYIFLSWVYWFLGKYNQAEDALQKSAAFAQELNHKGSNLHVVEMSLLTSHYQHNPTRTAKLTRELQSLCEQMDLPEYEGKLMCCQGTVLANRGDLEEGIGLLEKGIKELYSIGTTEDVPVYTEYLAKALGIANRPEEGLKYLDELLDWLKTQSLRYWHAEIFRRKGELLMQTGAEETALKFLLKSLETAGEQNTLSLALRSAISLFEYHQKTALYPDAKKILKEVFQRFDRDQVSADLSKAQTILNG